jgi:hypothetical protein
MVILKQIENNLIGIDLLLSKLYHEKSHVDTYNNYCSSWRSRAHCFL